MYINFWNIFKSRQTSDSFKVLNDDKLNTFYKVKKTMLRIFERRYQRKMNCIQNDSIIER